MLLKTAGFVVGVWWLQHMASLPDLKTQLLIVVFLLLSSFFIQKNHGALKQKSTCLALSMFAFMFVGVLWASLLAQHRLSDDLPAQWQQQEISVVGVIASLPQVSDRRTRFSFEVEKTLTPKARVPSHIGLNVYSSYGYDHSRQQELPIFNVGQRWQFTIKLKPPHSDLNPHGFDFAAWALARNIRALGYVRTQHPMIKQAEFVWRPMTAVNRVRASIKQHLQATLGQAKHAGVVNALVIGDQASIAPATWQLFLRAGITHLVSISGLHITMLSGLAFSLLYLSWRRFPRLVLLLPARKAATLFGLFVALAYALIAGFSVPTQRTFYMLTVFALALWSGRRIRIVQALCVALLVVLILDPWAVSAAGFWLSFGAVAVISFALNARLKSLHWFIAAVKTQWVVTLGLLPMLLLMFHQASMISPLANAVAIPLISLIITPLALVGGFLAWDWPVHLAHAFMTVLMKMLVWLDQLPLVLWEQAAPPTWTLVPALVGVLIVLLPKGIPLRFLGVLGLLPMLVMMPERPQEGEMQVTVLAVGQGLSVHVQTAHHDLLYDTGPAYNAHSDAGQRIVLPYLRGEGVRRLDALFVTHDDNDHSGGLSSILASVEARHVYSSYPILADIEQARCQHGQAWVWDGVAFEVLYPFLNELNSASVKDNDKSCVLKISSQAGSFLLTGDIERHGEAALLANVPHAKLNSTALLVPHHGSRTSSTQDFIEVVAPAYSVIANGYLNRFRHPNDKVLARYAAIGSSVYRTDHDGAVRMKFQQNPSTNTTKITVKRWQMSVPRYWRDSVESSF